MTQYKWLYGKILSCFYILGSRSSHLMILGVVWKRLFILYYTWKIQITKALSHPATRLKHCISHTPIISTSQAKVNALNRSNTHSGTERFRERYLTLVYCRSRPPWVFCHRPGVNIMGPSRKYFSVWQASTVKHSNKIWIQIPKQMDFTHYS